MRVRTHYGLLFATAIILSGSVFFSLKKDLKQPPVRIGVVLPLSGDYETYGKMGLQGAETAVDEINRAGGVLGGRDLELVVADNETDPYLAVRQTRKLIQEDDVTAILGPVSSTALYAMTEVAGALKTPLLYGINYEGGMYGRYLFCYSAISDHMIKPLVPYLAQNYGTSFYVFGYDYVWPHNMTATFRREVKKTGGKIAGVEFTPFGIGDYTRAIEKIKNAGADVLMLFLPGRDGITFIRQIHEAGLKKEMKVVAIAYDESYLKALGDGELEGVLTCLHFLSGLDREETRLFVARHKKRFGNDVVVTYATESHYGLVLLLSKAIEKAGTDNREEIIDAMEGLSVAVGNGLVTMREDHHMNLNMVIAEFTKGELRMKKEIGLIAPEDQKGKGWEIR